MQATPLIISTAMYCDTPEESTRYPSAGKQSHLKNFQAIYWKCIYGFFKSARYFNPEAELILFTNISDFPILKGQSISKLLADLNVKIIVLQRQFLTPPGYIKEFGNCYYKLDCLQYFSEQNYPANQSILLLDSDVVITQPLEELNNLIKEQGYVFYEITDPTEFNWRTPESIFQIYCETTQKKPTVPPAFIGGEFAGITSDNIKQLLVSIQNAYNHSLQLFSDNKKHLITEEHIYSYANLDLGFHILKTNDNPYIRRIWTGRKENRLPNDINHAIWHLPREKRYGFKRLYKFLVNRPHLKLSKQLLGNILGLPKATLKKKLLDNIDYLRNRLRIDEY